MKKSLHLQNPVHGIILTVCIIDIIITDTIKTHDSESQGQEEA